MRAVVAIFGLVFISATSAAADDWPRPFETAQDAQAREQAERYLWKQQNQNPLADYPAAPYQPPSIESYDRKREQGNIPTYGADPYGRAPY